MASKPQEFKDYISPPTSKVSPTSKMPPRRPLKIGKRATDPHGQKPVRTRAMAEAPMKRARAAGKAVYGKSIGDRARNVFKTLRDMTYGIGSEKYWELPPEKKKTNKEKRKRKKKK